MPPLEKTSSKVAVCKDLDNEIEDLAKEVASLDGGVEMRLPEWGSEMRMSANMVLEPKTGIKFPTILSHEDQSLGSYQILAGVGIKSINIVKIKAIKIYAFGFYIKPDGVKAQLGGKYGLLSSEELKSNSDFYEDFLSRQDLQITVRLVVHYKGLKPGMVRSAFETSLKNRLKKIKGVEDDEGLHIFNSYFVEDLPLSRGSVIDFRQLPGGQLRTEINGAFIGDIHSKDFCRALFDIYVGDPPVSLSAKQDVGEKICQLLKC